MQQFTITLFRRGALPVVIVSLVATTAFAGTPARAESASSPKDAAQPAMRTWTAPPGSHPGPVVADAGRLAKARELLASARASAPARASLKDPDTALAEATAGIPKFAGVWADRDARGTVVTVATTANGATADRTAADVLAALKSAAASPARTKRNPVSTLATAAAAADSVVATSVTHRFADLKRWHDALRNVFSLDGVVLTDLDERRNAVVVGVDDPARRETAVRAYAADVGVPADALQVISATLPSRTLRDERRPLVGGQQIQYATSIIGNIGTIFNTYACTLGVVTELTNASIPARGIMTNSHCSQNRGVTDGTYYWQPSIPLAPSIFTGNRFAYEAYDPPLYTGDPWGNPTFACPSGDQCRMSDATFGLFDGGDYPSTPRGRIARPGIGSTSWNGTDTYRITSTGEPTGGAVWAVGRTSGRSTGSIVATCIRINNIEDEDGIELPCQYAATYSSQAGDSGSPIFEITNSPSTNDVRLVGLNWGGGSINGNDVGIFSQWPLIEVDMWPFQMAVCASGFSC